MNLQCYSISVIHVANQKRGKSKKNDFSLAKIVVLVLKGKNVTNRNRIYSNLGN